jgi:hypothetical protein
MQTGQFFNICALKTMSEGWVQRYTPVIPITGEAEIERIIVSF